MKLFQYTLTNNEIKIWLLIAGLFVFLPGFLFPLRNLINSSSSGNACYDMTSAIIGLHAGLFFIIPLARLISWKQICLIVLVFLPIEIASFVFHRPFGVQIIDGLMLIGAYHSIYLFSVKGLLETWKFRKEKRFILSIILTSPLLVVLGVTAFVGFFFVINCF